MRTVCGRTGCRSPNGLSSPDMVAKEGIPMGGPYVGRSKEGPLYRNPFLAEPNCYGKSRFPFDYNREKPVNYSHADCPNGEALMNARLRTGDAILIHRRGHP